MECSEVRKKFDEYISNRLDNNMTRRIICHLEECPNCFEEYNILKELNNILKIESKEVQPAADFTFNIMDRIESEKIINKKFMFSKLPVINFGASLVLTGLLTIFINTSSVSGVLLKYKGGMEDGATSINTNINATTGQVQSYIRNVLNSGGK